MHRDKDSDTGKPVGTLIVDRRFKGIGRIKRASGTNDKKTLKRIEVMLGQLYDSSAHFQILEEIRDGVVSIMEVYQHWTNNRLEHLPTTRTLKPVIPTVLDWIDNAHVATPHTKKNYKNQVKRFCDVIGRNPPIQEIPKEFKRYKSHCKEQDIGRTFNSCRTVFQAYFNNNFKKSHTLWQQVSEIGKLKETSKRKAPQLSVVEFQELVEKLPKPHADIARALVLTGMLFKEVAGEWWCEEDRVVIKGTKTEGRDRIVPLIQLIHHPTRAIGSFTKQLKRIRKDLSSTSFRRTYALWTALAQIPRARKRMYMGHVVQDTTDIYEEHRVEEYLLEDATKLRKWISGQLGKQEDLQILPVMDRDEVRSFLSNPSDTTIL